jgi:hypothetical protein
MKTFLDNHYTFDAKNVETLMEFFQSELEQSTCNFQENPLTSINLHREIANKVATGCLFLRLFRNQTVPFDDDEWLDFYFQDVEIVVFTNGDDVYEKHFETFSMAQFLFQFYKPF